MSICWTKASSAYGPDATVILWRNDSLLAYDCYINKPIGSLLGIKGIFKNLMESPWTSS